MEMNFRFLFVLIFICCFVSYSSCFKNARPCPRTHLKNGREKMTSRGTRIQYACFTGFQIVGNKYAKCVNGVWDSDPPICVRPGCQSLNPIKNGIHFFLSSGAIVFFLCNPGYALAGDDTLYCNGRNWNGTAPTCTRSEKAVPSLSCSFEDGLCGWQQDERHDFDWTLNVNTTPSFLFFTGPRHDHTLGDKGVGHYLYIESTGQQVNSRARLLSPIYSQQIAKDGCFSFYYHMFGKSIGSLNVYQKPEQVELMSFLDSPDLANFTGFSRSGNSGNLWYRGVFYLYDVNDNFQIIIEGIRGPSVTSDIAIDDIAILNGSDCKRAMDEMKSVKIVDTKPDSCRNRCNNLDVVTVYGEPVLCVCSDDCTDWGICCPDYQDVCVFNDEASTVTDYDTEPSPRSEKLVASLSTEESAKSTAVTKTTPATNTVTTQASTKKTDQSKSSSPLTVVFIMPTPPPLNATGFFHHNITTNNNTTSTNNSLTTEVTSDNLANANKTVGETTHINSTISENNEVSKRPIDETTIKAIPEKLLPSEKVTTKTTPNAANKTVRTKQTTMKAAQQTKSYIQPIKQVQRVGAKNSNASSSSADKLGSSVSLYLTIGVITIVSIAIISIALNRKRIHTRYLTSRSRNNCDGDNNEVRYLTADEALSIE